MSMKRLLMATSVLALGLGGMAFAQTGNSPSNSAGAMGSTQSSPSYSAPSNSSDQGMSGADVNGSSANGGPMASNSASTSGTASASGGHASMSQIKEAQQALQTQGLYKGQVDGKWGPETRTAVSQFQKQKGLKQTAQLDEQTMNDLQNGSMSGSDNMSSSPTGSAPMNSGSMSGGSGNMSVGPGAANGASTQDTNPGGQNRGGSTSH